MQRKKWRNFDIISKIKIQWGRGYEVMKKLKLAAALLAVACSGMTVCAAEAPTPANENGIITADEWESVYPDIVASYKANSDNDYSVSYLEESPYLVNLYEGYGFAKDYGSARSHSYTLEDVGKTERPHPLANCLTCKTADYTKLVNDMGVEAYSYDFEETYAAMNESVGCYNCHENQAANDGELVVTHDYIINTLGDNMETIKPEVLACGQCHIEYYFNSDTKATSIPYDSIEAMDPEKILAYYDEIGFSDWTQESTGTGMLKAQHPEMETFLGEGSIHKDLLTCADCHMADATAEDGTAYTSHKWESPLENEALLANCAQCHGETDMAEKVHAIQDEITARETAVGEKLSTLKDTLAEAVAGGEYSEEELAELRSLYRSAQWYFDFDYVENSEGAHNSTMAKKCLDKSEELIDEAMGLFKA